MSKNEYLTRSQFEILDRFSEMQRETSIVPRSRSIANDRQLSDVPTKTLTKTQIVTGQGVDQRLYRLLCLMITSILFWGICSLNAFAQQPAGVSEQKRVIPFKPEPTISDVADTKVVVGLLVLFAIAIPVLYYLKKNYPSLTNVRRNDAKLKTIETRILTPRLKLYLIEVNGEEILLAHSAEGVTQVTLRQQPVAVLEKDNNECASH